MCNRARQGHEPETLHTNFATVSGVDRPVDNRFNPRELTPRSRAYVVREDVIGRDQACLRVRKTLHKAGQVGTSGTLEGFEEGGEMERQSMSLI